ncbi:MAG: PEP-CTERM sorting domain-containing protein [Pirellula sp.]
MNTMLRLLALKPIAIIFVLVCVPARADIFTETITFTDKTMAGNEFFPWLLQDSLPADATLLTVSVNATLNASELDTFANDLTIYVDRLPLFGLGGRLQVGGTSNLQAANRLAWANGNSSTPGTTVIDSKNVSGLNVSIGDAQVWYGNGFGLNGTSGRFTGTLQLTYFSAVPEPGSMALVGVSMSACLVGGLLRVRRRRRLPAESASHGNR